MPRIPRKSLDSSFIHVMAQGINKEYIFSSEEDIKMYLKLINKYIKEYGITIIAYCVMNNHVHFLFYIESIKELGKCMQRTNLVYSQYYNTKKKRCGMVFRNRYKSEPILNVKYLANCIQYIHMNPVKAGIVEKCEDYQYSSSKEYMQNGTITKSKIMSDIFGKEYDFRNLAYKEQEQVFIDIDKPSDYEIRMHIDFGINEYINRHELNIVDLLSNRTVLRDVIMYLKRIHKIQYKMIIERFKIEKRAFYELTKTNSL